MLNIWIQEIYGKERSRPVLPIIAKYLQSRIIGKIFLGVLVIKINAVEWAGVTSILYRLQMSGLFRQ